MNTTTLERPAIIDSHSGNAVLKTDKPFIIALKLGEDLFDSILRVMNDAQLTAASFSGLGAVDDVTLAYYNLDTKSYQTRLFEGMYELTSLNGNMAFLDGNRFLHIHGTIGSDTYDVYGGHFMSASVGPSVEISVVPLLGKIERAYDERTGLKIMCSGLQH